MTLQEIIDAYNTSVINAETYVWADGMADWMPLGQVEPIVTALNAGAPAPSQPPQAAHAPVAAPAPSYSQPPMAAAPMAVPSFGSHLPEPAPQPMAAAPRTAARREVGRGARDLFGGGGGGFGAETQPVADDVATSAPLFSASAHTPGPASSRPAPQPHAAPGQRDENSVLFSLSALTAKAGSSTPIASQTTATKDDSGLIDLRALSAGAPSPTAAGLVPDNAALFPLGMPVAAPGSYHPGPLLAIPDSPPKNRTPIFIGLGLVVAVAAVFGAFFAMKGGEEKPPPAPIRDRCTRSDAHAGAHARAGRDPRADRDRECDRRGEGFSRQGRRRAPGHEGRPGQVRLERRRLASARGHASAEEGRMQLRSWRPHVRHEVLYEVTTSA